LDRDRNKVGDKQGGEKNGDKDVEKDGDKDGDMGTGDERITDNIGKASGNKSVPVFTTFPVKNTETRDRGQLKRKHDRTAEK
jgi:hypothetical protein